MNKEPSTYEKRRGMNTRKMSGDSQCPARPYRPLLQGVGIGRLSPPSAAPSAPRTTAGSAGGALHTLESLVSFRAPPAGIVVTVEAGSASAGIDLSARLGLRPAPPVSFLPTLIALPIHGAVAVGIHIVSAHLSLGGPVRSTAVDRPVPLRAWSGRRTLRVLRHR